MPKRRSRGGRSREKVREMEVRGVEEEDGVKGRKKMKLSESLAGLATSDPEFYQYLRDNDHELLEFHDSEEEEDERESGDSDLDGGGGGGGGGEMEQVPPHISSWRRREDELVSDEEEKEEEEEEEEEEADERERGIAVTITMVQTWVSSISKGHSLAGVKQLSLALRAAVRGVRGGEEEEHKVYHVSGTSEFNAVVLACLTHVTPCLHHHLPPPSLQPKKRPFLPSSHKNWTRVRPVAESHCLAILELVRGLRDPSMVCAVLRHIQSLVSYYGCVSKLHRCLSRCLLRLWEGDDQRVQVLSFLILRQLTLLSPHPSLHTTLKKLYLTFVRNAKFTTLSSLPRIAFMKNCVVEIISLDVSTGYQHGFVYIRQLALHLRTAITSGKRESLQVVRCWQFVHCLDLWCQVLSSLLPSPTLSPLLYPLVEVTMGTLSLQPSPRTVPLRLHLVSSLSRLAAATDTFIPLAPFLLEILETNSSQLKSGSTSSGKPPEMSCLLKASASQLQSRGYQTAVLKRGFELLLRLLSSQSHLIGFPELTYPSVVRLRKMAKATPISWFRQQIKQLVEKVEEVSAEISRARNHVTFAPKDSEEIMRWERERRERGRDSLNRFLATWERLHATPDAPPTAPPKPKKANREKTQAGEGEGKGRREKKKGGKEAEQEREGKGELEGDGEEESDEEDVVEDFHFSSSDSDSD